MVRARAVTATGALLALAACAPTSTAHTNTVGRPAGGSLQTSTSGSVELGPGASILGWHTDFRRHTVPLTEISSGGPGRDGIPAVDRPRFSPVVSTTYLKGSEPLLVVEQNGEVHAYPYQLMVWHEIVNDTVGGTPVAVTFCPLCGTGVAYVRLIDGQVTTFGTTGNLRLSDMVMYDRATQSWWQQALGEGIVGLRAGAHLKLISTPTLSWDDFRHLYPRGSVMTRETGYDRPYGQNPYPGYDTPGNRPFLYSGQVDSRLPAVARVLGVRVAGTARGYSFDRLTRVRVVNDVVGGQPVVVMFKPGVSSALDAETVPGGRDVGTAVAWAPLVDGRVLEFERLGDGTFRDRQTGSTWNMQGTGTAGPLSGRRLDPVDSLTSFWFAWAAFYGADLYSR